MNRISNHESLLVDSLEVEQLPKEDIHRLRVKIVSNPMGVWTWVPVLVARGKEDGPNVAITAAMHGNELNGISIIQRLFHRIHPKKLRGTVIGVPVMNVPGYLAHQREFCDGHDLNRVMPGKENGNRAEVYAHRLITRVIQQADYLIDLHTASNGRINSLYVRADMTHPVTARMAMIQQSQIIVHNFGGDGTLRAAAGSMGIHAIAVEVGDPMRFQPSKIRDGVIGVQNVLVDLEMLPDAQLENHDHPILCKRSYWIYSDVGGVLDVFPSLISHVNKDEPIAKISNIFGDVIRQYEAPEDGVVIGKSTDPVNQTGGRILHLGIEGEAEGVSIPEKTLDELR